MGRCGRRWCIAGGDRCFVFAFRDQKVSRAPICAAKGMPMVVPGPKKSPRPPAGMPSCLRLVATQFAALEDVGVQAGIEAALVT